MNEKTSVTESEKKKKKNNQSTLRKKNLNTCTTVENFENHES